LFRGDHDSDECSGHFLNTDSKPVVRLSWFECAQFCDKYGFRLPLEAEWEWAYAIGMGGDAGSRAQRSRSEFDLVWSTHGPEGGGANAIGIRDMLGNVFEWCADRFEDSGSNDGGGLAATSTGSAHGSARVVRGIGWTSYIRARGGFSRRGVPPETRNWALGFRVCWNP
jgi:formylglycine-generating enzyme required for sulfatase activity